MLVNVFSVERQTQQVDPAGPGSAQQSSAGTCSVSQISAFTQSPLLPYVLAEQVKLDTWSCGR